jgi:hypothetical protein
MSEHGLAEKMSKWFAENQKEISKQKDPIIKFTYNYSRCEYVAMVTYLTFSSEPI